MPRSATSVTGAEQRGAAREDVVNLQRGVAYLRRQVRGLQSKLHGELALVAVRIEDNDRRAMKRRKVLRRWVIAGIIVGWLWRTPGAVQEMLNGPFLLPALLLVGMMVAGGMTIMLLLLHNEADEQEHTDRYHNWFRLTERSPSPRRPEDAEEIRVLDQ